MAGAGENHGAFLIVERTHTFAALRNDGRRRYALQSHPALFANGPQAMEKHFIAHWIDGLCFLCHSCLNSCPSIAYRRNRPSRFPPTRKGPRSLSLEPV